MSVIQLDRRRRTSRLLAVPLLLLSSCCIDYEQQRDKPPPVFDTADGRDTASPEWECDGLDDDGDGAVDEGFPDLDGDGVADCVDDTCSLEPMFKEDLDESPTCAVPLLPSLDPWDIEMVWEATPSYGGCYAGAVIADLDGDGASDVVVSGREEVAALSGSDGSTLWIRGDLAHETPLALADVDSDGSWNVLVLSGEGALLALDADGSTAWRGSSSLADLGAATNAAGLDVEVADLLGDGHAEVIAGHGVASAEAGSTLLLLEEVWTEDHWFPSLAVADLDGEGQQEFILGASSFGALGTLRWDLSADLGFDLVGSPSLVQADADRAAEQLLFTYEGSMLLVDDDGALLFQADIGDGPGSIGLACAGDLDGDGAIEVVLPTANWVRALELDGTLLWEHPMLDTSVGYLGCSLFDLDSDGAEEVLVGDMEDFYILDGPTGVIRFQDSTRFSLTGFDVPMVADLDGDGSVEIIVPSICDQCEGDSAIRVYRNANRDWPPGSPIWPSATWSGTSLFLDGSIPRTPEPSWLTTKIWRGQPEAMLRGWDLRPEVGDSCASSCDPGVGQVLLTLRVVNLGPQEVQRGAPVAIYGLDQAGVRSLLEVRWFTEFIDNGWASASVEVALDLEQALLGIVVVAGDDGGGALLMEDCNQRNNEVAWRLDACE
jgi:outer membrane protein assembly factor BamB